MVEARDDAAVDAGTDDEATPPRPGMAWLSGAVSSARLLPVIHAARCGGKPFPGFKPMLQSEVVEIDGVFVGTAILQSNRTDHAFFATHDRLRLMHGAVLPSLAALRQQAARYFRGVRSTAETIVAAGGSRRS